MQKRIGVMGKYEDQDQGQHWVIKPAAPQAEEERPGWVRVLLISSLAMVAITSIESVPSLAIMAGLLVVALLISW